jgi:hypothetical protein
VTEPLLRTKLEKQRHGLGWGRRDALKTLRDLILALEGQCKHDEAELFAHGRASGAGSCGRVGFCDRGGGARSVFI